MKIGYHTNDFKAVDLKNNLKKKYNKFIKKGNKNEKHEKK